MSTIEAKPELEGNGRAAPDRATIAVENPATGQTIASVPDMDAAQATPKPPVKMSQRSGAVQAAAVWAVVAWAVQWVVLVAARVPTAGQLTAICDSTTPSCNGLAIFNDPNRANCAACHSLEPGSAGYPLFTDFGYDNIGVPKNPANPFYSMPAAWNPDGDAWVDYGLGDFLKSAGYAPEVYEPEMGKVRVPTLRNVDLRPSADFVKAYGHNGYFKSLEDIVFFYHWRGMMDGGCMGGGMGGGGMGGGGMGGGVEGMSSMFPPPEVDMNRAALSMFPRPQVDNIVAFLKTLSDGYFVR